MASLELNIERKTKANKVIRFRSLFAAGAGFIPVPVVDAASIMGIQLWMLKDLAKIYDIPFKQHVAKSLIGTLVGNIGATGVVKFIPGLGTLLGGGTAALSGAAATYALGKIFTQHFDQGGTLLSFDPIKSREYFQQFYEEGKVTVKELQAHEAGLQGVASQAAASTAALKQANEDLQATILTLQSQLQDGQKGRNLALSALPDEKKRKRFRFSRLLVIPLLLAGAYVAYRKGYFGTGKMGVPPVETKVEVAPPAPEKAPSAPIKPSAPSMATDTVPKEAADSVPAQPTTPIQ